MLRRTGAIRIATIAVIFFVSVHAVAYVSTPYSQFARAFAWGDADVEDHKRFPARTVHNAPPAFSFQRSAHQSQDALASTSITVRENTREIVLSLDELLTTTGTTAFLVIHDDTILYENYFNGYDAQSTHTSFSMAKSFVSALIGIAIDEGYIKSVDEPITTYLPELLRKDSRFRNITIRHLLTMSSGIRYVEGGTPWSDDTTTYYAPNLRTVALSVEIDGEPGKQFHYNNFNPLLLGLILERATGRSVSTYLEQKIWQPLGMEAAGSWSLDSTHDGFEKMESGLNGRARDFAKFGRLFLHRGAWNGRQLIPQAWVDESTRVDTTSDPSPSYQYLWWVTPRDGQPSHFSARGNLGQYIYVVPEQNLIMVRFGTKYGYEQWPEIFEQVATKLAAAKAPTP
jgi:CubicO group peptidase (beta-lactamase class C family)